MLKRRKLANKVPRKGITEIREEALIWRDLLESTFNFKERYLDISRVMEKLNNHGLIDFRPVEDSTLPVGDDALAIPDQNKILVKESVYIRACDGVTRDRFTLAHELGHLVLHKGQDPAFAFSSAPSYHHHEEDSEWQANSFAASLLIDHRQFQGMNITPKSLHDECGVSWECAGITWRNLKDDGEI